MRRALRQIRAIVENVDIEHLTCAVADDRPCFEQVAAAVDLDLEIPASVAPGVYLLTIRAADVLISTRLLVE